VIHFTDTKVNVSPFSDSYQAIKDIPIATVATAWDDPGTGEVIILYIHEALYFGDRMSHTLLCPNQLRANGWTVQDVPKQFDAEAAHAITDPSGRLTMPLEMNGVISYLPTRLPTDKELAECDFYDLTSEVPWEPYSPSFHEREQRMAAEQQMAAGTEQRMAAGMATEAETDSDPTSTEEEQPSYEAGHMDVDPFDDGYLLECLIGSVRLTDDGTQWMIATARNG
jgi:hypothetical protein